MSVCLDAWVDCEGFSAAGVLGGQAPYLDVCATLDESSKRLYLSVVNLSKSDGAEIDLEIAGATVVGVTEHLVTGPAPDTTNSFATPDAVRLASRPIAVASSRFQHDFPPLSAAVLEFVVR